MTLHVIILLALFATSFTLFVIASQKKSVYSSLFFPYVFLAMAVCVLGYVFEAFAVNIDQGYTAVIVKYFGVPYVPPLVLMTLLDYYHKRPKWPVTALIFLPAAVITTLVASWPINGIYYSGVSLITNEYFTQIQIQPTMTYYVLLSYTYIIYIAILVLSIRYGLGNPVKRKNTIVILSALAIPIIFNIIYVLGFTPYHLDFLPYSMPGTLVILSYSIFRLDAFDILPQAKEIFLENMNDALIVVNRKRGYIYSNNTAKRLFPILIDAKDEEPLSELLPILDEGMEKNENREIELSSESGTNSYYIIQNLLEHKLKTVGYCLTLHDITEDKTKMEKLQAEAEYDGLTRVYNRNTFNELARGSMNIADAEHVNSCVFYLDIDHFKTINDTYGHLCGDLVLQKVVEVIKQILRRSDLFGRLGGEEFGIFFMNITKEAALRIAETIRKSISETNITYQGEVINVTISIGIALSEFQSAQHFERLLEQADSALYRAKGNGRNRVELWKEE